MLCRGVEKMTDNEIIKALKCHAHKTERSLNCCDCDYIQFQDCSQRMSCDALELINRLQAENTNLDYKLTGVMHFVDKWLDGAELKQDEVNRASVMREKTLQIVEKLEEENDFLKSIDTDKIRTEAIKEYKEKLIYEIVNRPSEKAPDGVFYMNCRVDHQNEIIDIINVLAGAYSENQKETETSE